MQVSVETTDGLERKLRVEIPANEIDGEVEKRVADTAKKIRLDGFRPGKVPLKVVRQRFGEALRQEVVQEVAQKSLQEAVTEQKLKPVGDPSIEPTKNESGENLEFVATFEVYPEIELCSFSELKIDRPVAEVTEKDIDEMIEKLRDQQCTWSEVERPAISGDQVNIDYRGTKDGEEFEGGSAQGVDLELGSGRMIEGFESGLEGATSGDKRTLNLKFPGDYRAENLRDAEVEFEITVNSVSEKVLPDLDDEFFKKFDVEEGGLEAFRNNVRESMEKQLSDSIEAKLKQQIMDGLHEKIEVPMPKALLEGEIQVLRQQSIAQFGGAVEQGGFDESLLPDELFEEQARRRVALGVIMSHISEAYEIRPEREKVMDFLTELASTYENPSEVRDFYLSDESRLQQVQMIVIEKMIVDRVLEDAEVSDQECNYEEAVKTG